MAPPAEYLEFIYLPMLARAGLAFQFDYPRAGFYPKGGGEITCSFSLPDNFAPLKLVTRGPEKSAGAIVVTAGLPATVGTRGTNALRGFLPKDWRVEVRDKPSPGTGAAVFAFSEFQGGFGGFTGLGERGKPMEKVSAECGSQIEKWLASDAAMDEHLADQLVLPMSFASGSSLWRTIEVTEHLRTVLQVVQMFVPVASQLEEESDGSGIVRLSPGRASFSDMGS
jgi:RNA 3'-terminal phosphate cyclase (ATP)